MLLGSYMQSFIELAWLGSILNRGNEKSYEEAEETISGAILAYLKVS